MNAEDEEKMLKKMVCCSSFSIESLNEKKGAAGLCIRRSIKHISKAVNISKTLAQNPGR